MLLKRFYDDNLAQASYLIGCSATGEALVIDAHRDVAQYLRAAEQEGLRITHVTETHIHADFVSGSRELAERAGAKLFLSDEGDALWKYAFAVDAGAVLLKDGASFMVGNIGGFSGWEAAGNPVERGNPVGSAGFGSAGY